MVREVLKGLGLNTNEVKVYLACLSLKLSLASTVARKTGMNRSTTYGVLKALIQKGYLCSIAKNKTNYYTAVEPDVILERLKLRIDRSKQSYSAFEKIIPMLSLLGTSETDISVEFYEGLRGVHSLFDKMLSLRKPLCGFEAGKFDSLSKELIEHIYYFRDERIKHKVPYRVICPSDNYMNVNNKDEYREVIKLDKNEFTMDFHIMMCDEYTAIGSYKLDQETGILIKNRYIADNMRFLFEFTWNLLKGKKYKIID